MPGTASKNKGRLWIAVGLLLAALTVLLLLSGDRQDSRVAVDDGTGTIWITPIADLPVNSFARRRHRTGRITGRRPPCRTWS